MVIQVNDAMMYSATTLYDTRMAEKLDVRTTTSRKHTYIYMYVEKVELPPRTSFFGFVSIMSHIVKITNTVFFQ